MAGLSPKLPIQRDAEDGYALTKTYTEMVLQNLKNLLLTVPGERMMDPAFGVGLNRFIFEQHASSTYANIQASTAIQVEKYMPFVRIDEMFFYGPLGVWVNGRIDNREQLFDVDPNLLQVKISLTILPLSREVSLELNL